MYELTFSTSSTFASGNYTYKTGANTITISGLAQNTPYYARVRAVDSLGLASASWSLTLTVTTSTFPTSALSDGIAPSNSPAAIVTGGYGHLFVTWTPITNADPVTYEIHLSTTTNFTPVSGTKVGEVSGTAFVIEKR